MKVIVQTQNADKQPPHGDAAESVCTPSPCIDSESVIMETSADQSWADFCRTLQRPALLLGDFDQLESEQP
jgi:crotonobetainyl-CoA:carnitine CoA-transferase CaiB-like acyl-CoA transferase